ncbi:hypothetical protein JDV02_008677 [Purpureocillium takamizusanense]|uniref:Zn(2)-C6 fungal-type domain-containing protein n=1 Tax=Purpureocillium takamizusanense TaxID=2060973 RepID=A0A9Q8QKN7_9HYPO|nr:uncharacterized protein JDV02_008677 [Purpureocillium takamizusanense]UNI22824.1 hypothetical protein JDV02_008677 [Purpureocillium takamizusanense]
MRGLQASAGRKGSRKVRTGCVTCKIRKVKCDEAKPSCQRCTTTGRRCDGYVTQGSRHQSTIRHAIPIVRPESSSSRRAFDFYHSHAAHVLRGISEGDFWDGVVLQLSLREPSVRHAVLAVSGFLECATSTEPASSLSAQRNFAYGEYSKAIHALRKWDARGRAPDIPLLVCVLFICIEFLLDRDHEVQLHVCQGRNILHSVPKSISSDFLLIKNDLVPIYTRLSLTGFLFGSRPAPIPDHLRGTDDVQAGFTSLEQARYSLCQILDHGLRFTIRGRPAAYSPSPNVEELNLLAAEQQSLLTRLSDWRVAFVVLAASPKRAPSIDKDLLQIYLNTAVVWISTALQPFETAYDAHTPAFASIIADASAVLNSFDARSKFPLFTFETELIAPLYWTAIKCRHPHLRRAAVGLLMRDELRNRRENMWSGKEAIVVARRVIELEEAPGDAVCSSTTPDLVGGGLDLDPSTHPSTHETVHLRRPASNMVIPLSHPPTVAKVFPPMAGLTEEHCNDMEATSPAASMPRMPERVQDVGVQTTLPPSKGLDVHPPYGMVESRRIKNILIEPRQPGGVWVSTFRDLEDGKGHWHIDREFLAM